MAISKETKEHLKWLKQKKKEQATRRASALAMYDELIAEDGRYEEDVFPEICEKFDIARPSTIKRWLMDRGKYLNPKSKAVNDVMVLKQMERLLISVKEYDDILNNRMEELDAVQGDWVEVEQSEDTRGTSTKRISKYEALRQASKERVNNSQEFFRAAKSIIPQTVLNQVIDNRKDADAYSDAELDNLLNGEV